MTLTLFCNGSRKYSMFLSSFDEKLSALGYIESYEEIIKE